MQLPASTAYGVLYCIKSMLQSTLAVLHGWAGVVFVGMHCREVCQVADPQGVTSYIVDGARCPFLPAAQEKARRDVAHKSRAQSQLKWHHKARTALFDLVPDMVVWQLMGRDWR